MVNCPHNQWTRSIRIYPGQMSHFLWVELRFVIHSNIAITKFMLTVLLECAYCLVSSKLELLHNCYVVLL